MKNQVSMTERAVGALILVGLVGICVWVYERQSRFDASVLVVTAARQGVDGPAPSLPEADSPFRDFMPDSLAPLAPPEQFNAETLSEKIDGKAELYLSSGFVSLTCQRFARVSDRRSWLELFVYDMGEARNAFSVFSSQRRAEAEDADPTRFAYRTPNALFMAHGGEYVEIVGSDESLMEEMLSIGKRFVESRPQAGETLGELALFPRDGLDPASITLLSANVFGYEKLDGTYTAAYAMGEWRLMAFISRRSSPEEARSLAAGYERFLIDNGGRVVETGLKIPGARVIHLFDVYEVIFTRGERLAGVHEADDQGAAEALAARLYEALP
jgi:hypothetical protein